MPPASLPLPLPAPLDLVVPRLPAGFREADVAALCAQGSSPEVARRVVEAFLATGRAPRGTLSFAAHERVVVTSDVHADVRRFGAALQAAGILALPPGTTFAGDGVYDPALYAGVAWTAPPGTLLVVLGDLVDGARPLVAPDGRPNPTPNHVDDPRGCFEVLLHVLLFNLRVAAARQRGRQRGGVVFTLGNHEHHTLVLVEPGFCARYVHPPARALFGSDARRAAVLLEFYRASPHYFLEGDGVFMAHGGFAAGSARAAMAGAPEPHGADLFDAARLASEVAPRVAAAFAGGDWAALRTLVQPSAATPRAADGGVPLPDVILNLVWSRVYAAGLPSGAACRLAARSPHDLMVFGHCTVGGAARLFGEDAAAAAAAGYGGCAPSAPGRPAPALCVLPACGCAAKGGPTLAFVDVGMARQNDDTVVSGYRPHRPLEFLLLRGTGHGTSSGTSTSTSSGRRRGRRRPFRMYRMRVRPAALATAGSAAVLLFAISDGAGAGDDGGDGGDANDDANDECAAATVLPRATPAPAGGAWFDEGGRWDGRGGTRRCRRRPRGRQTGRRERR